MFVPHVAPPRERHASFRAIQDELEQSYDPSFLFKSSDHPFARALGVNPITVPYYRTLVEGENVAYGRQIRDEG